MFKISEIAAAELEWVQPSSFKMEYELQFNNNVAATLRFDTSLKNIARGQSGDGSWSFDRPSFWSSEVVITDNLTGAELGRYKKNFWGNKGSLELPYGRKIISKSNFWQTQFHLETEEGLPILHYQMGGFFRANARLTLESGALNSIPELPWLVILGWYLIILLRRDSSAAAAS